MFVSQPSLKFCVTTVSGAGDAAHHRRRSHCFPGSSQDPPGNVKSDTVTTVQRDSLMVEQARAKIRLDSLITEKQKK
jgi:hypothetical protein